MTALAFFLSLAFLFGLPLMFVMLAFAYAQKPRRIWRPSLEAQPERIQFRLADLAILILYEALAAASVRGATLGEPVSPTTLTLALLAAFLLAAVLWGLGMVFLAMSNVQSSVRRIAVWLTLPLGVWGVTSLGSNGICLPRPRCRRDA
ncbi:MAG: hypothetical protein HYS13_11415 [Planctomycetia bacterium]|nr:hypothetical protein [Planctomycetia bacterium]